MGSSLAPVATTATTLTGGASGSFPPSSLLFSFMFTSRSLLVHLVAAAAVACCAVYPRVASAQDMAPNRLAVSPGAVPQTVLAPVDEAALRVEDARTRGQIAPQRVGVTQTLDLTPATRGTWTQSPGGASTWRLRVRSGGARGVSLRFEPFAPPEGAELRVYDRDGVLQRPTGGR